MRFQAYRSVYAPINRFVTSRKTILVFLLKFPLFRVPCAPVRSDFSRAFEDSKQAQEKGFYSAVLCVEGEK